MKNYPTAFVLFQLLIFIGTSSFAQEDEWKFKREKNGIKVYTRDRENSNFKELLAKTVYKSPLTSLISVSMDINSYDKWVYSSKESTMLDKISETELIYHTVSEVPWPFQDRDVVLHSKVFQDPETKVVTIESNALENYYPEQSNIVRIPELSATWTLTPLPNGDVNTVYYVRTDPGGNVPAWLLNLFIDKAPIMSFEGLRQLAKQEPYKSAILSFIIN